MLHMLWKPGLENFEHYFTSVLDENINNINIQIIQLPEGKEGGGVKNVFEEIITTNYPNLKKETEAWRIENRMNLYRPRPKHIMKMEKFKERIEKAAGEIPRVIYKETSIRLSVDFLAETFQARRE